ncbi:GNAT family N-acetyltransferase [Marinomonas foliarum]|uniref:Acetyltransferase (GNAT) family protein n=1 Tax=Marinomonas foliarum TaxID=491950 RepID=A0A369AFW3_9GAMM|nr:GNAT family N-acetyltransferase [Marinomonas foliarum]RCX07238.1 acetyltransferase (GNAT) family protein [Marinomonas foliarum]
MKIRIACKGDQKSIEESVKSAYMHYIDRIGIKPAPMLADYNKAIESHKTYVLEDSELGVVGVLVLVISKGKFLLENIAIHTSAQGKGYGKALLQLAEKTARELKFDYVELYTHEKMNENISLYQRIGYDIFDRIHESGYSRVYMKKYVKG